MDRQMILMEQTTNKFTQKNILPLFLRFALPGVLAMVFLAMQTITDGFLVGRLISATALAGVNIVSPAYAIVTAFALVIGVGCQAQLCLNLGKQQYNKAKIVLVSSLIGLSVFSVAGTVLVNVFAEQIASFLGADAELLQYSMQYIYGVMPWLAGVGGLLFFDYILKGLGHPREAMCIMIGTIILNIALSFIFITMFGMGTFGAGLGTGLSFTTGAVIMLIFVVKEYRKMPELRKAKGRFSSGLLCHIVYNGSSEGLAEVAMGITTFMFNIMLMKYAGSDGVAAFTILSYLIFVGASVVLGVSNGVIPILSYNYGAGFIQRVKSIIRYACSVNLACGLVVCLTLFFFSRQIVGIFFSASETNVIDLAVNGGRIVAFAFLFNVLNIFASSFFTAMDRGGISLLIASLRGLILLILFMFTLTRWLGIDGIWLTTPAAEAVTFVIVTLLYIRWWRHNDRFYII